jgi:hypothetical protein
VLAHDTKLGYIWNGHVANLDPDQISSPQDLKSSAYFGTLEAGKTLKRQLNASKLYDMTAPGSYTIQVQRRDPETDTMVKSNTITVTITE